tara:strand:+ start:352 stop:684 length:333 start_codon:yes stop_codon:yes gene_type:complete
MKNSNELVKQVSREIIAAGVNLELDWEFGDVDGRRGVIEKDYAYIGSGRYNGIEGFYFRRDDDDCFNGDEINIVSDILNKNGFEVEHFSHFEIEWDGDRAHRASVGFYKK